MLGSCSFAQNSRDDEPGDDELATLDLECVSIVTARAELDWDGQVMPRLFTFRDHLACSNEALLRGAEEQ